MSVRCPDVVFFFLKIIFLKNNPGKREYVIKISFFENFQGTKGLRVYPGLNPGLPGAFIFIY